MSSRISCNELYTYGHFGIKTRTGDLLVAGFYDRSKTRLRGIAASLGKYILYWCGEKCRTSLCNDWNSAFSTCVMGRDRFTYCLSVSSAVGTQYLLTTQEDADEDFYHYLMHHYKLPLLRRWMPALRRFLCKERIISQPDLSILEGSYDQGEVLLPLNGKQVPIESLICFCFSDMEEQTFESAVSRALKQKIIWISEERMEPLRFHTFDDYLANYGVSLVDNLNKKIQPLTALKPNVDTLALKNKSLFPQQAASVNGVLAMMEHGYHHAILNMGMGVGKTLQAISAIDAAMVKKWLKAHSKKKLQDAYQPDVICYRAIIMSPGHLVNKWAQEILEEIPHAKAVILHGGLSQLIALKQRGRKPDGKEFYILSMDYAKLDTWQAPIPYQMKYKPLSMAVCRPCYEEYAIQYYKKGHGNDAYCPCCHGNDFMAYPMPEEGKFRGLVCPSCGELLLRKKGYDSSSPDFSNKLQNAVLAPKDFASPKGENSTCYHCGTALWGSSAKPVWSEGEPPRKPKWYKVSHYTNHTKKAKTTAYVLKGHEAEYFQSCITTEGLTEMPQIYGPRKVAPAKYIKKQLKGFFDFCVLDEAHKYLGDSAQGVAAHALIKSSRFTLALTGTISNGTASSFFNLFWMISPAKMKQYGYSHSRSELLRFCREYGCVETEFEWNESTYSGSKNLMSRGRQLGPPRIKPGISPVILGRFMIDSCLFLDLSDLSKHLPQFSERIRLLPVPEELDDPYRKTIDCLKNEAQNGGGMGMLSVMLQFGLSYLDKPYGRGPIKDPYHKDAIITTPENFEEYSLPENLSPKESELIDIINQETSEGRNCFVYATYTGKPETNVTWRLKDLIERKCNLTGRVEIIQPNSPAATKREEWFHKRAAEGIKVFISNPKNVETGLDFCFKHNGRLYNFPTLIFYQTGYSLETIWQSSRRAFRLNQKEECRNYYLAYEDTLQAAALEIMAKKQTATAAIQGKFSTEGLSAMARGVDTRTQLAASLSRKDHCSRESLENMFDALNKEEIMDDGYQNFIPSLSYYELMNLNSENEEDKETQEKGFTLASFDFSFSEILGQCNPENQSVVSTDPFGFYFGFSQDLFSPTQIKEKPAAALNKKAGSKGNAIQTDLFSFLAV